jgi:hypothetical protein
MARIAFSDVSAATDAARAEADGLIDDMAAVRTTLADLLDDLAEQTEAEKDDPELYAENYKSSALLENVIGKLSERSLA